MNPMVFPRRSASQVSSLLIHHFQQNTGGAQ